ncbi:hypothetical protein [Vibrio phage BONAISHI]|nr:hypothetical protein [Vibrio phage BONAISHI]
MTVTTRSIPSHQGFAHGEIEASLPLESNAVLYLTENEYEPFILQNRYVYKLFLCTYTLAFTYSTDGLQDSITINVTAPIAATLTIHYDDLVAHWPSVVANMVEGNVRLPDSDVDLYDPKDDISRDFNAVQAVGVILSGKSFRGSRERSNFADFENFCRSIQGLLEFKTWLELPGNQTTAHDFEEWRGIVPGTPHVSPDRIESIESRLLALESTPVSSEKAFHAAGARSSSPLQGNPWYFVSLGTGLSSGINDAIEIGIGSSVTNDDTLCYGRLKLKQGRRFVIEVNPGTRPQSNSSASIQTFHISKRLYGSSTGYARDGSDAFLTIDGNHSIGYAVVDTAEGDMMMQIEISQLGGGNTFAVPQDFQLVVREL